MTRHHPFLALLGGMATVGIFALLEVAAIRLITQGHGLIGVPLLIVCFPCHVAVILAVAFYWGWLAAENQL